MSALNLFRYADQPVRSIIIDGEPWFVAADVARILGYRMASDMTRRLDPEDRGTRSVRTPSGDQDMTVINEPGLYASVLGSQVPSARDFKRWVTHEVLPQIRRTGQFGSQVPTTLAEALELAAVEARRVEALEAKAVEDAPKVAAYNTLMDAEGFYTMEAAAKLGGIGRTTLFRRLREAGVIQSGSTLPYQRYMHWFKITTSTWEDSSGVAHLANTTRVLPSSLDKVLAKAAVEIREVA